MSNEYRLKAIKEIASENAGANLPAAPASIDFYGEDVFHRRRQIYHYAHAISSNGACYTKRLWRTQRERLSSPSLF